MRLINADIVLSSGATLQYHSSLSLFALLIFDEDIKVEYFRNQTLGMKVLNTSDFSNAI